jgi:translation initiation factor IF-1
MDKKVKGNIVEALPSLKFRVECEDGKIRFCYLAGRLHRNFIRILVGDSVDVFVPSTGEIGRIIRRNGSNM